MSERLTEERERQIQEFGESGGYLTCSRTTLQVAYRYHTGNLLTEIDALRRERDEARAMLRLLWDDIGVNVLPSNTPEFARRVEAALGEGGEE